MQIWNYHEPAWREYQSARAYVELLRADGWEVEAGSGEMPTAFVARWGSGGPVLGAYWTYLAMGGRPDLMDPGMFTAGRTIAATLLDLATQPDELARAKAELTAPPAAAAAAPIGRPAAATRHRPASRPALA